MIGVEKGCPNQLSFSELNFGIGISGRTKGFFLENHKDSVQQLYIFGEIIQLQAVSLNTSERDMGSMYVV